MNNEYLIGNTLVDMPRLLVLEQLLKDTSHLPGEVAEVGVYRGGTARWICERTDKPVMLFDTFKGMPPVDPTKDLHKEGDFDNTSAMHVVFLLDGLTNWTIAQGIFPKDTAKYATLNEFSFVHLDVDIYTSVKECLEFFWPRMNHGGIIVLDDYNEPNCPGAKLATDEFCAANGAKVTPTVQSQAIITKE